MYRPVARVRSILSWRCEVNSLPMVRGRRRRIVAFAALAVVGVAAVAFSVLTSSKSLEDCQRTFGVVPGTTAQLPAEEKASGQLLVAHDRQGDASIIDLSTGTSTYLSIGFTDPHEVAVSPDGRWGIMSDYGTRAGGPPNYDFQGNRVAVIDMVAKRVTRIIDLGAQRGAHDVVFLPGSNGRALVTTQTAGTVTEIDVETGAVSGTIETQGVLSHLLAVSSDGRFGYTANEGDGSISRLDLSTRKLIAKHVVGRPPIEGIAITVDDRFLLVGSRTDKVIRIVDVESGRIVDSLTNFQSPDRIGIAPGSQVAGIVDTGCMYIVDVGTRRVTAAIPANGDLAFTAGGRSAFVGANRKAIVLVDLASGRERARYTVKESPHGLAWGPRP